MLVIKGLNCKETRDIIKPSDFSFTQTELKLCTTAQMFSDLIEETFIGVGLESNSILNAAQYQVVTQSGVTGLHMPYGKATFSSIPGTNNNTQCSKYYQPACDLFRTGYFPLPKKLGFTITSTAGTKLFWGIFFIEEGTDIAKCIATYNNFATSANSYYGGFVNDVRLKTNSGNLSWAADIDIENGGLSKMGLSKDKRYKMSMQNINNFNGSAHGKTLCLGRFYIEW